MDPLPGDKKTWLDEHWGPFDITGTLTAPSVSAGVTTNGSSVTAGASVSGGRDELAVSSCSSILPFCGKFSNAAGGTAGATVEFGENGFSWSIGFGIVNLGGSVWTNLSDEQAQLIGRMYMDDCMVCDFE